MIKKPCFVNILSHKNKVIIFGNGGSAATSSHFSVDLTKNAKINCINFNDADLITCFSNDYGFDNYVKQAINCYCKRGDLVIAAQEKEILDPEALLQKVEQSEIGVPFDLSVLRNEHEIRLSIKPEALPGIG